MFQTFEATTDATSCQPRLAAVRQLMMRARLDALLIPRTDAHQGEYVAANAERLRWLSGFTGSAGLGIVTTQGARLLVDGRYITQARSQTDAAQFQVTQISSTFEAEVQQSLLADLKPNSTIGYDPWLHTIEQIEMLQTALGPHGHKLKATPVNLIDRAWGAARPPDIATSIVVLDDQFTGQPAIDKIRAVQADLRSTKDAALIVTLPDNIAWLFNIRGADIPHTPVALAFAIVPAVGKPALFLSRAKAEGDALTYMLGLANIHPTVALEEHISALIKLGSSIRIDPRSASYWFLKKIASTGKLIHRTPDIITRTKAQKNIVELEGARRAHIRDGGAVCKFLCWFDKTVRLGGLDEIGATRQLEDFRRATGCLRDISFDTIAGAGPNGAIVHYRVTSASNRAISPGELFLIDSGGQYLDGTTDITRTLATGPTGGEERTRFTLVLKGHIAIATARFPVGTRGVDIDAFARTALWQCGLDYDHGTGHGVGSFLSVHEGPQSISRRGMATLEPGMICSNEPGYYCAGAYGIRLENLCVVLPPERIDGGDRPMLGFETLTLAPFDRRLIDPAMLSSQELQWLNQYHARVLVEIGSQLDGEELVWLTSATAPIA